MNPLTKRDGHLKVVYTRDNRDCPLIDSHATFHRDKNDLNAVHASNHNGLCILTKSI